jgi:hypothetical protein
MPRGRQKVIKEEVSKVEVPEPIIAESIVSESKKEVISIKDMIEKCSGLVGQLGIQNCPLRIKCKRWSGNKDGIAGKHNPTTGECKNYI